MRKLLDIALAVAIGIALAASLSYGFSDARGDVPAPVIFE